jgi:flagella basal body P-ring formation protein FlgA
MTKPACHHHSVNHLAGLVLAASLWSAGSASGAVSNPAPTEKLAVRPTIVVNTSRIDASVLVSSSAPDSLKAQLAKIPIGVINKPLGELALDREAVKSKLGHFSELLEFPQRVQILRSGELLPGTEISQKIIDACKGRTAKLHSIEMDISRLPDHVVLPGPLKSWSLKPMSTNPLGMVLFALEADCEGGKVRQILQVELWQTIRAAKLTRLVTRGETLGPDSVVAETVKVKNLSQKAILSYDEVIGRKATLYKSSGSILRIGEVADEVAPSKTPLIPQAPSSSLHLSAPVQGKSLHLPAPKNSRTDWVIKPGEKVDFTVVSGSLTIRVPAKALEGGCVGDPIKLVNLQNNKSIEGIITGEGKVSYAQ